MPFSVFAKLRNFEKICTSWGNFKKLFSKNRPTIFIFAKKICGNNLFLEKNQLPRAFAPVLHLFSRKLSLKQIFPRKSAKVSCHQNIFTRVVPLFLMLRTRLTFFVITLLCIFLQEIFANMRKWFSRKVINDFRVRNFRFNPTQHYETS